jgi:hypothetical protein
MHETVTNKSPNVRILGFCSAVCSEAQFGNLVTAVDAVTNSAPQAVSERQSEVHRQHKQSDVIPDYETAARFEVKQHKYNYAGQVRLGRYLFTT